MKSQSNIMVGGEAGQGIQSAGLILARTIARGGLHIFADQDYESRVRGGHNFFRIRVNNKEIMTLSKELDILIALNEETIDLHQHELKDGGVIVFDQEQIKAENHDEHYFNIPIRKIAYDTTKNKLMANIVAIGAVISICGYDFKLLEVVLKKEFNRHGKKIVDDNVIAAQAGFIFAHEHGARTLNQNIKYKPGTNKKMLLNGNEALALGALAGGCKFISGYPMTPTSSILEYLADKSQYYDVVAMHVEDEIAAVNMAIGAAYAGVRAMVATSGGGFCLMTEGLSLAGMTETPLVMVLGQRPGPATGLPTRTEQGELLFALHAGHGEFPRAILAPATIKEVFNTTIKAFNFADTYQIPVIVLTDHHIASSYATVEKYDLTNVQIDRGELISYEDLSESNNYKRYVITDSGISPRAFPGQFQTIVITDSDEHDEIGHPIEDAETRNRQSLKRSRKLNGLKIDITDPTFSKSHNAMFTLVGWGSTYGAIIEAAEILKREGIATNVLHFSEICPFPAKVVSLILNNDIKSIVIENNTTAQMSQLIQQETGHRVYGNILKFDGRPFSSVEIVARLKKEVF